MAKRKTSKDPKFSAGARYERKTIRAYLARRIKASVGAAGDAFSEAMDWVLRRQGRYDDVSGGLGKKLPRQVKK